MEGEKGGDCMVENIVLEIINLYGELIVLGVIGVWFWWKILALKEKDSENIAQNMALIGRPNVELDEVMYISNLLHSYHEKQCNPIYGKELMKRREELIVHLCSPSKSR